MLFSLTSWISATHAAQMGWSDASAMPDSTGLCTPSFGLSPQMI